MIAVKYQFPNGRNIPKNRLGLVNCISQATQVHSPHNTERLILTLREIIPHHFAAQFLFQIPVGPIELIFTA